MNGFKYLSASLLGGVLLLAQQESEKLPEGKGKAEVQKVCGGACHGLEVITSQRKTKEGWTNVVDTMVSRGAQGSDQEIELVITYLAEHFPREKPRQ